MARMQGDMKNRNTAEGGGAIQRAGLERGFAAMDQERQRTIASQGGRAAHRQGVAHEFSSEEARAAGRKGGASVSQNREHMAAIGALGGRARADNLRARSMANGSDADVRPDAASQGAASDAATSDAGGDGGLRH